MTPHAGQRIAGRYLLDRTIAEGGMGSVWIAEHEGLATRVAMKFIAPELARDATARTRFAREAQVAARLHGPHVVQILDYGIEGDQPYIAMEYLAGENLEQHLAKTGPLPLARAAELIEQIAQAIELAHAAGVVHRDLKPSNIFLAEVAGQTIAKVGDFGIAKQLAGAGVSDDTTTGTVLGSPHAMSPEQARGGAIDHRSDLWSLAVVAFRMITGRRPFEGATVGDLLVRICTDPIPRASSAGEFSAGVDAFFARAFERDVERRFGSARELADAFSALAADPQSTIRASEPARHVVGRDAPTMTLRSPIVTPAEPSERLASPAQSSSSSSRRRLRSMLGVAAVGLALAIGLVAWGDRSRSTDPARANVSPAANASSAASAAAPVSEIVPPAPTRDDDALHATPPARDDEEVPASAPVEKARPETKQASSRADASRTEPARVRSKRAEATPTRAATKSGRRYDPFSGLPID